MAGRWGHQYVYLVSTIDVYDTDIGGRLRAPAKEIRDSSIGPGLPPHNQ